MKDRNSTASQCKSNDLSRNNQLSYHNHPIKNIKSVMMVQNINDSGSVDQGEGDYMHPLAESHSQPIFTVRNRN